MQHSLQTLRATLLLLMLTFIAGSALAQKPYSFSPSGPVYLRAADGGQATGWVTVTNETNSPLKIWVTYVGDTSLHYAYGQYNPFTIGPDSAAGFPVTYRAQVGDTSVGYLRIRDSLDAPDSVFFVGMDTTVIPTWGVSPLNLYLGSYYQQPDSEYVTITNYTDDALTVNLSMQAGSYGIEYSGSNSRTIAANSSADVLFRYLSASYAYAQGSALFMQGGRVVETKLHGRKLLPPRDSLYSQSLYSFDTVQPGDTVCQTVRIFNPFDTAVTISSFTWSNGAPFYISNAPALPLVINEHDTLEFTVCYPAPAQGNAYSSSYLYIQYQFAGDSTRNHQIRFTGTTPRCFTLRPTFLAFGSVLRDSVVSEVITIFNRTNASITIDADFDQAGPAHFAVLSSLPITIGAYDSALVYIQFTATGSSSQYAKLIFDGGTGCGSDELGLSATITDTNIVIDSSWIGLFADEMRSLSFVGDSNTTSITYRFYNDQGDSIKVTSVWLTDTTHFTITDIAPHNPWFKLGPYDLMEVTIAFNGDPGTYEDTLMIATETGFIAHSFPIHVVINGTADVGAPAFSGPRMMVQPNPSSGPVTISVTDVNKASIEVLDIMGKRVLRFDSGHTVLERNTLAAGTYFVRASGVGADGKPFVMTTRIVIK